MDTIQTARMIEWLDQERRRDKNTIATLEERLQQQQEMIDGLMRQINGLENEQSSMRSQFLTQDREQELIRVVRKEINDSIEGIEAKRLTAEREAERRNDIVRESIMVPVRQLEDRLEQSEHQLKELMSTRGERDRLMSAMAALQQRAEEIGKKIEEPERRITFLEEQRRQDSRRLSEVQSTLPEIQKSIDQQLRPKIELMEGLIRGNEKRILEVQNAEASRREEVQAFLDQQELLAQQREQQINDLTRRIGAYDDDIKRNLERFESWADTHRDMRKIVDDFERIGDRLERRINEVAEMQRLSEERFRSEWNDWTSEDQVRWKEFTVSHDEAWRVHEKELQSLRNQIQSSSDGMGPLRKSLDRLWELQRAQAELYKDRYQALLTQYDETGGRPPAITNGDST